jgi:hypothetical protein
VVGVSIGCRWSRTSRCVPTFFIADHSTSQPLPPLLSSLFIIWFLISVFVFRSPAATQTWWCRLNSRTKEAGSDEFDMYQLSHRSSVHL